MKIPIIFKYDDETEIKGWVTLGNTTWGVITEEEIREAIWREIKRRGGRMKSVIQQ